MEDKEIKVWEFSAAPEELKKLGKSGGDEDWLALVPPYYGDKYVGWLESESFGCFKITKIEHPTKTGYNIYVGCHS